MITRKQIEMDTEYYISLRRRLAEKLRRLPEGSIYYKKMKGVYRPFMWIDGKEKYLSTKNAKLIRDLNEKRELTESIVKIDANIKVLDKTIEKYTDFAELMPSLIGIDEYDSGIGKRRLSSVPCGELARRINQWASDHYGGVDFMNDTRTQTTTDGQKVRSKSELALYEQFKSNALSFKYEQPLYLGDKIKYPDFTLIRKMDGRQFIWEHFGMMGDPVYYRKAMNTIYMYMDYGFLPYDNFICTFDKEDGGIDLMNVDSILRAFRFVE